MKKITFIVIVLLAAGTELYSQSAQQKVQPTTVDQLYLLDLKNRLITHYEHPDAQYLLLANGQAYDLYLKSQYRQIGGQTVMGVGVASALWVGMEAIFSAEFDEHLRGDSKKKRRNRMIIGGVITAVCIPSGIILYKSGVKLQKKAVDIYNDGLLREINRYKQERGLAWSVGTDGVNVCLKF